MERGYINLDVTGILFAAVVLGIGAGAFLCWLVPELWSIIAPIIHEATR